MTDSKIIVPLTLTSRYRMSRDSLSDTNITNDRYVNSASALHGLPGDLLIILLYAGTIGTLLGYVDGIPSGIRFVLGIPLLLFIPGYSLLAALFPGRPSRKKDQNSFSEFSQHFRTTRSIQQRGIRWGERVALSFGLSLFIIPLLALGLDLTPFPFRSGPIVATLSLFSLTLSFVGIVRRLRLPRTQRFAVPLGYWIEEFTKALKRPPIDAILNVVLILSIVVAAASMTYALAVPQDGETYTSLFLVTQNGSEEPVAANYPTNFTTGEEQSLIVGIKNKEQKTMNYTMVVQLQRINDADQVTQRERLDQFSTPTVPENQTWRTRRSVAPEFSGKNLKLTYLLYRGEDLPQNPNERNSYRETLLWINISN